MVIVSWNAKNHFANCLRSIEVHVALKRFVCYKALQYLLGVKSEFGRGRIRCHLKDFRAMKLLESPSESLRGRYLEQCQKVLAI